MKVPSIGKTLLYLTIIAGFEGAALLSVDIGLFNVTLYRIFVLLLWMLFLMESTVERGGVDISRIKIKTYLLFLFLWLWYAVFSLAWSSSMIDGIKDVIVFAMGISVIVFTVLHLRSLKDFERFYALSLLILLGMLGLGFWNYFTGQHLREYWNTGVPEWQRFVPVAVFQGQNDYATYLSLSIPLILSFLRYNGKILKRVLGLIVLVSALYLLVMTLSRANYIAVMIEIAFWFLFLMVARTKLKAIAVAVLIVLAALTIFTGSVQDVVTIADTEMSTIRLGENSITVRINLVKNALVCLKQSYGFGVGAGSVEYSMETFGVYNTWGIPYVHNVWVEVLMQYGVVIGIGYLMFCASLLVHLYKAYGNLTLPSEKMICEALLLGLIGMFVATTACEAPIVSQIGRWVLFAFALGFLNYYRVKYARR